MSAEVPKIVVTPPGPKAKKWLARTNETMAPYNRPFYYPLVVAGGKGAVVYDVDGNAYIDWNSGLGVLNVGQSNPRIIAAITRKASAAGVNQNRRLCFDTNADFLYQSR